MAKQVFKISRDDVRYIKASYAGISPLMGAEAFERAAWIKIGEKHGFDGLTAGPAYGMDERYVMAVPSGKP